MNQRARFYTSKLSIPIEEWLSEGCLFSLSPDRLFLGWGKTVRSPTANTSSTHWFYFPDYFLDSPTPWMTFSHHQILSPEELLRTLDTHSIPLPPTLRWTPPFKTVFQEEFERLQTFFENRTLKKIVLYTSTHTKNRYTSAHLAQSIRQLCEMLKTTSTYLYGFWNETAGTLGATPEKLFSISDVDRLETMALAGTQKSDAPCKQMEQNPKLVSEHAIVVEDICTQLSELGTVHQGELQEITLPLLRHLFTPITVQMREPKTFEEVVQRLHPTPALGGHPRVEALNHLRNFQKTLPRGHFGAPVGYKNGKTNEQICYVGIRNGTWNDQGMSILAGCGIIPESSLEEEWDEALLKIHAIKGFLKV